MTIQEISPQRPEIADPITDVNVIAQNLLGFVDASPLDWLNDTDDMHFERYPDLGLVVVRAAFREDVVKQLWRPKLKLQHRPATPGHSVANIPKSPSKYDAAAIMYSGSDRIFGCNDSLMFYARYAAGVAGTPHFDTNRIASPAALVATGEGFYEIDASKSPLGPESLAPQQRPEHFEQLRSEGLTERLKYSVGDLLVAEGRYRLHGGGSDADSPGDSPREIIGFSALENTDYN